MSDAIQQAEELRGRAIALLLAERQTIDDKLAQFGHTAGTNASVARVKQCKACGESGHTARFHKGNATSSRGE